jgi:hypothetical protein
MYVAEQQSDLLVAYPYQVTLPGVQGEQGALHFLDYKTFFPEGIHRCFWITEVPHAGTRGNHAHWKENQLIIAVAGSIEVFVLSLDGSEHRFNLRHPSEGVYIPKLNWVEVTFISGASVLVISDHEFSEKDFIRDKFYFERLKTTIRST